jgi:hypothetical protein
MQFKNVMIQLSMFKNEKHMAMSIPFKKPVGSFAISE